jgi:hypothetical protein
MRALALILLLLAGCAGRPAAPPPGFGTVADVPPLSCVPFARALSGVALSGDAHTWWAAAAASYGRSRAPVPGAVLVIARSARLPRGHLAVVLRTTGPRSIDVAHANWGSAGDKGRVEQGVPIIDTSAANDWSEVAVWYAPIGAMGNSRHAAHGFILPPRAADPASLNADIIDAAWRAARGA